MYNSGKSSVAIAKELGISQATVWDRLSRAGYTKRTQKEIMDKPETRKKMSDSHKGKPLNPAFAARMAPKYGEDNPFYGKHHAPESKKKMSESHRAKAWSIFPIMDKGRAYRYVGGQKHRARYRIMVESAIGRPLSRDEFVHHANGNPLDDRPENLVVMSRSAHSKLHSRLYWENFRKRTPSP